MSDETAIESLEYIKKHYGRTTINMAADRAIKKITEQAADIETQNINLEFLRIKQKEHLDELEKVNKSNEFLKGELKQLANFNPDWDMLETTRESLREKMIEITRLKTELAYWIPGDLK